MGRWQIEIARDDIAQADIAELPDRAPAPGEAEFAIDLVALTANNITYAALGQKTPFLGPDAGYWLRGGGRGYFGGGSLLRLLAARQPCRARRRSNSGHRVYRGDAAPRVVAGCL